MFKNSILRYLNSAATFDAENEGKSAAQLQRDAIAASMTVAKKEGEETETETETETEEENEEDREGEEGEEEEEKDETKQNENETEEQKTARLAKEKEQAKEERKYARMQKRINRVAAERDLTRAENEELRKQLAAKTVDGLTEEEVNARAKKLADDIVNERRSAETKKQFEKDCDKLRDEAVKANKKFDDDVADMANDVAPIPGIMIGILADLDNENGGKVLNYLAQNVDEYEDIHSLSEGRMTAKLIRLSDKLKAEEEKAAIEAKKKDKKQHSNVPAPVTPVSEGRDVRTANAMPANPTKNMDDFVRIRNLQDAEKRKQRGY